MAFRLYKKSIFQCLTNILNSKYLTVIAINFLLFLSMQQVFAASLNCDFKRNTDKENTSPKENEKSPTGYYSLKWSLIYDKQNDSIYYRIEQSNNSNFSNPRSIYFGSDTETFISGKKEGLYFYRVRAELKGLKKQFGAWSKPYAVRVEYQSMILAWTLFIIGAIIFVATTLVILKGHKETKDFV